MLDRITRLSYGVLGLLYVSIGAGSLVLPIGWLPPSITEGFLAGERPSPFVEHLLQEFGATLVGLGLLLLWAARRREWSPGFHWAVTFLFALDALIHWIGPHGPYGSWSRGIVNSIPFAVLLALGLLRLRMSERRAD